MLIYPAIFYQIGRWVSYQDGMFIPRLQMTENIERGNKTTQFPLRGRKARIVMIEVSGKCLEKCILFAY